MLAILFVIAHLNDKEIIFWFVPQKVALWFFFFPISILVNWIPCVPIFTYIFVEEKLIVSGTLSRTVEMKVRLC